MFSARVSDPSEGWLAVCAWRLHDKLRQGMGRESVLFRGGGMVALPPSIAALSRESKGDLAPADKSVPERASGEGVCRLGSVPPPDSDAGPRLLHDYAIYHANFAALSQSDRWTRN